MLPAVGDFDLSSSQQPCMYSAWTTFSFHMSIAGRTETTLLVVSHSLYFTFKRGKGVFSFLSQLSFQDEIQTPFKFQVKVRFRLMSSIKTSFPLNLPSLCIHLWFPSILSSCSSAYTFSSMFCLGYQPREKTDISVGLQLHVGGLAPPFCVTLHLRSLPLLLWLMIVNHKWSFAYPQWVPINFTNSYCFDSCCSPTVLRATVTTTSRFPS